VADADRQAGLVGELLQLELPEAGTVPVAATAVGGDLQQRGAGVAVVAEVLPPGADRGDGQLRGLGGDPDVDVAFVGGDVVDTERDRLARGVAGEVVGQRPRGLALGAPLAASVLELADQLLLLGV